MTDPAEEAPAILNLDSGVTLSAIASALKSFARTIPDLGIVKITFTQTPDVGDANLWKAGVTLQVFGGLKWNTPLKTSADTIQKVLNVEPDLIKQLEWTAEGPEYAGAVEELRSVVEEHLKNLIVTRQRDLVAANEALLALRNPGAMDAMWAVADNPQDEAQDEPSESP
jgi:hypothetical protein